MGSGIGKTSDYAKGMTRDAYSYWFEKYDAKALVYPLIYKTEKPKAEFDMETTVVTSGGWNKQSTEGKAPDAEKPTEGYTKPWRVFTYHKMNRLTWQAQKFNKIDSFIQKCVDEWAPDLAMTKEEFFARPFNEGGVTAGDWIFNASLTGVYVDPQGDLCYDGKPFFARSGNERSSKNGGTYYNALTNTGLDYTNLAALNRLLSDTNAKNENDKTVSLGLDSEKILLTPPALYEDARRVLQSTHLPGSANNDINPVENIAKPIKWNYIDTATAYYLGYAKKGISALDYDTPEITVYKDEDTGDIVAVGRTMFGFKMTDWRYWAANNALAS